MKRVVQDETGMFDQNCELTLWPEDEITKEHIEKYNQCHGDNGRFCSSGGGGGGGGSATSPALADDEDPGFPEAKTPQKEPETGLTMEEQRVLKEYVGADYAFINAYSRNPAGPDAQTYLKRAEILDQAFVHTPPLKGEEIVYRGINAPKEVMAQLVKGAIIQDKGFMSTSIDRDVAQNFGSTIFNIRIPKGAKAIKVQQYITGTTTANEKETLLPRNTRLKITHVRQERSGLFGLGKKTVVDARVLLEGEA